MKLLSVRVQTVHNVTIINNKRERTRLFKERETMKSLLNKKIKERKVVMFLTAVVSLRSNSQLSRQLIFRGQNICYVIAPNCQLPFAIDSNQLLIARFVTSYLRRLKFENKKRLSSSILLPILYLS